ncbi:hypothetical protein EYF80_039736 [Liparis tanakae]|uniref:Uncharacterized protein n=1 Tax=Liparis tanakae TaxID=230148 RepID=A0A4Z2G970_9TELE|nr:hypothetical protein EYF80_039736 [Liparis tanakae]
MQAFITDIPEALSRSVSWATLWASSSRMGSQSVGEVGNPDSDTGHVPLISVGRKPLMSPGRERHNSPQPAKSRRRRPHSIRPTAPTHNELKRDTKVVIKAEIHHMQQ